MNFIHQRPQWQSPAAPWSTWRAQQFCPPILDQPANMRVWKRLAQCMNCRQRMDHIPHSAEPDNQQPLEFVRGSNITTSRIGTQAFCTSRVRRVSLVECSYLPPTPAPSLAQPSTQY